MTLDEYFAQTYDYLEGIGLDVFLIGSTLLGMMREKRLLNRFDHDYDKEINIGCLAEDLTKEIVDKIKKDNEYVLIENGKYCNNSLIFFAPCQNAPDQWNLKPGFTLLAPFFREGTKRIESMGGSSLLLTWDDNHLNDKSKWGKIEYLGKKYKIPAKPKKWLKTYFGDDWEKENKGWHWMNNAQNISKWEKVYSCRRYLKKRGKVLES